MIGERPRIAVDDLKTFPFCRPESHPNPARAHSIVKQVAALFDEWANEVNPDSDGSNLGLKNRLNGLVYDYFALSDTDRIMVSETAKFIAPSIQPADYEGISTPLLARPGPDEVDSYVSALGGELMRWRDTHSGNGALSVTAAVDGVEGFLGAVRIATTTGDSIVKQSSASRQLFETFLADVTAGLNVHLGKHDRSELFRMPNIMVIANDAFYFLKPLRRRFWLTRTALADADCIVRTVQAVRWSKSGR